MGNFGLCFEHVKNTLLILHCAIFCVSLWTKITVPDPLNVCHSDTLLRLLGVSGWNSASVTLVRPELDIIEVLLWKILISLE